MGGWPAAGWALPLLPLAAGGAFQWQWHSEEPIPASLPAAAQASASSERPEVPQAYKLQIAAELDCQRHGWERREGGRYVRVFDTFLFMWELDLLEARLNELYDWVHAFAFVELGSTYQGTPRNSSFAACLAEPACLERFLPFLDKVLYIFVGAIPHCQIGSAWECEYAHRDILGQAFESAGGGADDVAIVADVDEFPRAATAWVLSACDMPDKAHIQAAFYYFSARCLVPWPDLRMKAVRGRVLLELGAQVVRAGNGGYVGHVGEPGWANLTDGGFHLAYFMTPEEIVQKIQSFSHGEFNEHPYTSALWHLENARSCVFSVAWVHVPAMAVRGADVRYPRVPWYALQHPDRMWRFFAYMPEGEEEALPTAEEGLADMAVCISGQLRGQSYWSELGALRDRGLRLDVFAVVPEEDCKGALELLSPGRVKCLPDLPLTPEEQHFVKLGPQIDFLEMDHRQAHVLQYRLVSHCGRLVRDEEDARGSRYRWVMRKRADLFLRDFPRVDELPEDRLLTAYRDKDQHLGGLNDKVLLGPPELMDHVFQFYEYMLSPEHWPALRLLCSLATFGRPLSRYYQSVLSTVTGPAETILQNYLMVRAVLVQAHRSLRYDRAKGAFSEASSLEPMPGPTGIFGARLNYDNHSNAYPRDPYLLAPILNVVLHDQELTKPPRKLVVLDFGCGTGYLVKELLAWKVSAVGIDGNGFHKTQLGHFGIVADLTERLGQESYLAGMCGMLKRPGVSAASVMAAALGGEGEPLPQGYDQDVEPGIADWVLCIDVGSYVPPEHQRSFLLNLIGFADHGVILRWGNGPHGIDLQKLEGIFSGLGYHRDVEVERHFALFSGLVGPHRGEVLVLTNHDGLPGGVLGPAPYVAPVQTSVEHVIGTALSLADSFEPSRKAAHFFAGEDVWLEGEVEILIGILRLWRAYWHPAEAEQVLAPLHLRSLSRAPDAELAWGNVTWDALAAASWDASELLRMHLARDASALAGLASAEQVAWLARRRKELLMQGKCRGCLVGAAGEARPLFSPESGNGLAAGYALAAALAEGSGEEGTAASPRRPTGLHRQVFLSRLASRFSSG